MNLNDRFSIHSHTSQEHVIVSYGKQQTVNPGNFLLGKGSTKPTDSMSPLVGNVQSTEIYRDRKYTCSGLEAGKSRRKGECLPGMWGSFRTVPMH